MSLNTIETPTKFHLSLNVSDLKRSVVQFVKFGEAPWFTHDAVELRELKVIGWKPGPAKAAEVRQVLYKGPFRQAVDDMGTVYPRGQHYKDYAKFELANPPVVLALIPSPQAPGGTLNHLGLRLPDSVALVEAQRRLEEAGMPTQRLQRGGDHEFRV